MATVLVGSPDGRKIEEPKHDDLFPLICGLLVVRAHKNRKEVKIKFERDDKNHGNKR